MFIIRASEAEGYKFLANPVPMSFLALPAYPNPTLRKDKKKLIPVIAENTKRKICCLLSAGLYYGQFSQLLAVEHLEILQVTWPSFSRMYCPKADLPIDTSTFLLPSLMIIMQGGMGISSPFLRYLLTAHKSHINYLEDQV